MPDAGSAIGNVAVGPPGRRQGTRRRRPADPALPSSAERQPVDGAGKDGIAGFARGPGPLVSKPSRDSEASGVPCSDELSARNSHTLRARERPVRRKGSPFALGEPRRTPDRALATCHRHDGIERPASEPNACWAARRTGRSPCRGSRRRPGSHAPLDFLRAMPARRREAERDGRARNPRYPLAFCCGNIGRSHAVVTKASAE